MWVKHEARTSWTCCQGIILHDILPVMFSLVGYHLTGRGECKVTVTAQTMEMVRCPVPSAVRKCARFVLVKLFETLPGVGVVTDMIGFMLLHITLVLEGEVATNTRAMKMRGALIGKGALSHPAWFCSTVTLEAVADKFLVFLVEILMRHHIGGTCVNFGTISIEAMVMGALAIEVTHTKLGGAVISGGKPHETVCQRVISLLVHVVVPDNIRFVGKSLEVTVTVSAMEMVTIDVGTVELPARITSTELGNVLIENILIKIRWVQCSFFN